MSNTAGGDSQFADQVDYAEEEYPGEETITLSPWDKFQIVERNEGQVFYLQDGDIEVVVRQAMPEEVPEDDMVFWAEGNGKEVPRKKLYTCDECGDTQEMNLHTEFDPETVEAPCETCNEQTLWSPEGEQDE